MNFIIAEIMNKSTLFDWLLGAILACLCEILITMRLLKRSKPHKYHTAWNNNFSFPDFVTFGRGLLVACVAGFLPLPEPTGIHAWLPGSLYFLAVLADYGDGYLARLHNCASEFGAALDRNFDALTTLIGSLLGIHYGQLPLWYLSVGLAFYVFSIASWIAKKSGKKILSLSASLYRRLVGGSNALFIGLALTPALPGRWLVIPATIFTALILAGFFRDWLFISGAVGKMPFIRRNHSMVHTKIDS
jgi:CDP-diacylglycerol--glycerol-3-phosphate 3-phosphatidyltransferase